MRTILWRILDNFLHGHGRVVGFPIYRYLMVFALIAPVIQLVTFRIPESVREVVRPEWYDLAFVCLQIAGALLVLTAILAMRNTPDSAQIERAGVILTGTAGIVQFIAACAYYDRLPVSQSYWIALGFSVFCFARAWQVTQELRETGRIVKKEILEGEQRKLEA